MANLIGQRLGQYEIIAMLGEGGMAVVYRARQTQIKRDVAIKVIEARLANNPEFVIRFEREAQTIATLSHSHILKVFDYGKQDDILYIVTELLSGGTLADLIRRELPSLPKIVQLMEQIASALDYAHSKGIIHRDLKPQNVLLDEAGNAYLTDFGIAKIIGDATALTMSGAAIGTPAYMAPEQWQNLAIDARADIYAFGVILFEMLTGRVPFTDRTPASMMFAHLQEEPPQISSLRADIPAGVQAALSKALAKEPQQRFSSASQFVEAIKAALTNQAPSKGVDLDAPTMVDAVPVTSPAATRPAPPSAATSVVNNSRLPLFAIGAVVVALLVIGGLFALTGGRNQATATPVPSSTAALVAVASSTTIPPTVTVVPATATPLPPTVTALPTETLVPSITPNAQTLIAGTIAARPTQTAYAIASWTKTPTSTPTATANEEQTLAALVGATDTAVAIASFTKTPTPSATYTATNTITPTSTDTLTATPPVDPLVISPDNASHVVLLKTLAGHTDSVHSLAFSSDGKLLASAGDDKTIRLWDAHSGLPGDILRGHTGKVTSVAFSPDGTQLASTGNGVEDKTLRFWNVNTGKFDHSWPFGGRSLVYSADGTRLALANYIPSAFLQEVSTGVTAGNFSSPDDDPISVVALSRDGSLIAGAGKTTVYIWDIKSGKLLASLEGHTDTIESIAFSPDGTLLASGGDDKTVRLWDVKTRQLRSTNTGHTGTVYSVVFSPDGALLASGGTDSILMLADGKSGQPRVNLPRDNAIFFALAFSPDGKTLASAGYAPGDMSLGLWGIPQATDGIAPSAEAVAAIPATSGQRISFANGNKLLQLLEVKAYDTYGTHSTISPDKSVVAFAGCAKADSKSNCLQGEIRLVDVKTGKTKATLQGHTNYVASIAFSPDGTLLASGSWDNTVRLWDVKTGQSRFVLKGHTAFVDAVAFSPDGTLLASAGLDYNILLWDVKTGTQQAILEGHREPVSSLAFSPDGTLLASGGLDKTVRLWDVKAANLKTAFRGFVGPVTAVAFSPDGNTVASGSCATADAVCNQGEIRLWDVKTSKQTTVFPTSNDNVTAIAFSPDGSVVVYNFKGYLTLREVKTGKMLKTDIIGTYFAFSADGTLLAVDNRLWGISPLS